MPRFQLPCQPLPSRRRQRRRFIFASRHLYAFDATADIAAAARYFHCFEADS
jgi:hypothetical protein